MATILNTATIGDLQDITGATLSESATDTSTLELSFAGFGPEWVEYMAEVRLSHHGHEMFAGKVTAVSRTNSGGSTTTDVTVSNMMWLLSRQTLAQQMADIIDAAKESSTSGSSTSSRNKCLAIGQIGGNYGSTSSGGHVTWAKATSSMGCSSSGWVVSSSSVTDLTVTTSPAVGERVCWATTDKLITTASALYKMRKTCPDVQYIVDYEAGTITATAIGDMGALTIDSADGALLAADGITPQYEEQITGVVIAYTNSNNKVTFHKFPADISEDADGVKVFSLSGGYYVSSWDTVAQQYYEAANVLQYGGSVRVTMDSLDGSPLGHVLNLTGPGCHSSWATMDAAISAVEWDFLTQEVTMTLGRSFSDPSFADAEESEESGGSGSGDQGSDTGIDPWAPDGGGSSSKSDSTTPVTPGGDDDTPAVAVTYTAARTDELNYKATIAVAATGGTPTSWTLKIDNEAVELAAIPGTVEQTFAYDTVHVAVVTAVIGGVTYEDSVRIYIANSDTSNTGANTGDTSTPTPTPSDTTSDTSDTGTPSTDDLEALKKRVSELETKVAALETKVSALEGLEARVKALEDAGTASVTMAEVNTAINNALATVKVEVQAGGTLESTSLSTGNLTFSTTAQYS